MVESLALHFLGGCDFLLAGQPLEVRSAKGRALLAYIAVTGGAHARDTLAALLWDDDAQGDPRAYLRTQLSGLRRALPEHLTITRDAVAFNAAAPHDLDVYRFLQAQQHPEDLAGLRSATELYRGDFLAGFHAPGAPAFDTWLMTQREQLRGLVLEALWRLAAHHTTRAEYGVAQQDLRRFLTLDPWREDAHRQLMQVLALDGQREAALAQYATCCQVLAEELGIDPTAETTQLYTDLRAGSFSAPSAPVDAAVAERRQLTLLSAELTGIGDLTDPEVLDEHLEAYQQVCLRVIADFAGVVAHRQGATITAHFGVPLAREDDARRAVQAGLALLAALSASPVALGVRIGVQTGMVVVKAQADGPPEVVGLAAMAAARLLLAAHEGDVLIGEATELLVRGFFSTSALAPVQLEGLANPVQLHRVLGETEARSRLQARPPLTPLIGRARELATLQRCWSQARAGRRQAVLLSGEAGVGKSRLLHRLREEAQGASARWLEAACAADLTNSPFAPLISLLERELGFVRHDTPGSRWEKLRDALARADLHGEEVHSALSALLGLPDAAPTPDGPERQRRVTLDSLTRLLLAQAASTPLVMVLEDAHWCDPSTREVMERLLDHSKRAHLLVVVTTRPEGDAEWTPLPGIHRLPLTGLPPQDTAALVTQLAQGAALSPDVLHTLQERSDGVPLYVEELTRGVLDRRASVAGLPMVPSTLQDALTARLDRLGTGKGVAQLAAVIGRTFTLDLLTAASSAPAAAIRSALRHMLDARLIEEAPGQQFTFRHALIQDAAYDSLVRQTRQGHHARVAEAMSGQFSAWAEQQPELLARHYAAAGQVERALPLWQQAAGHALGRSAYQEAQQLFRTALMAVTQLPDTADRAGQELTLLLGLGVALHSSKGYGHPEVEAVYRRAEQLTQTAGETPQRFTTLLGLVGYHIVRAQYSAASDLVRQLYATPAHALTPLHLATLDAQASRVAGLQGQLNAALSYAHRTLHLRSSGAARSAAETGLPAHDAQVVTLSTSAVTLWLLGYPDQANAAIARALQVAEDANYPYMRAAALSYRILLHFMQRDLPNARPALDEYLQIVARQGLTHLQPTGYIWQGLFEVNAGQAAGLKLIREGLDRSDQLGVVTGRPLYLGMYAQAQQHAGELKSALHAAREALALVDQTGERWWEAELHRVQGELLFDLNQPDAGEASLRTALHVAKAQDAKSLELRAALSLARLPSLQEGQVDILGTLTELQGWFTEGWDTPDGQDVATVLRPFLGNRNVPPNHSGANAPRAPSEPGKRSGGPGRPGPTGSGR